MKYHFLKKKIENYSHQIAEFHQKESEAQKAATLYRTQFLNECAEFKISGKNIKDELSNYLNSELVQIFSEMIKMVNSPIFKDLIKFYRAFTQYVLDSQFQKQKKKKETEDDESCFALQYVLDHAQELLQEIQNSFKKLEISNNSSLDEKSPQIQWDIEDNINENININENETITPTIQWDIDDTVEKSFEGNIIDFIPPILNEIPEIDWNIDLSISNLQVIASSSSSSSSSLQQEEREEKEEKISKKEKR